MPDVAEAVFLDTNLWLYALIKQDADKQKIAKELSEVDGKSDVLVAKISELAPML